VSLEEKGLGSDLFRKSEAATHCSPDSAYDDAKAVVHQAAFARHRVFQIITIHQRSRTLSRMETKTFRRSHSLKEIRALKIEAKDFHY
jgi:hypothetical protein